MKTLTRQEYIKHSVFDGHTIHTWIYHYDDGSVETLKVRRKEK
jgi:carbonic anhydrase